MDNLLKPLSALGHDSALTLQIGPYQIVERNDVALASLAVRRGRDAELATKAQTGGIPLPPPARAETREIFSAFWVTPEMWFVEAPIASHEDIAAHLKTIFNDIASITEQTDAWVRLDLSAADLTPLLERMSNTDPDAPAGFASRTVIDHLGCYLIKRGTGEVTLYGPRSSAASLLHGLEVAMRSIL